MDIGTGLAILGSKDIINKILGPTADYLGDWLLTFAKKNLRIENLKRIFDKAKEKLGDKINEKGAVSPRVLKGIINEGSWSDDFLSIEYFSGVLASSKTGILRDDRGVYFNALISRLSAYQLRMHYIFYHAIKKEFNGKDINIGMDDERHQLRLFISWPSFIEAMDFTNEEIKNFSCYLDHIINGLVKENLTAQCYMYGDKKNIQKYFKESPDEGGLILQPSFLGVELFYWAYGLGGEDLRTFLNKDKTFELDEKVILDDGFTRVDK